MATKSPRPLISVVIPVHNAGRFLPLALDSILAQTYTHFEVIVVDDGSTDDSYKILKQYARKSKKIKIFRNATNLNISHTLNKAISKAKGHFIARMDADDIAISTRFEKQIKYLQKHSRTVVVGGQCITIDQNDNLLGTKQFPTTSDQIKKLLFVVNPMQHPTMMINRDLLPKNFAWYNPQLPPAEDLDLLFRLAKYGDLANLSDYLLFYRLHLDSSTFKNPQKTFRATKRVRQNAIKLYSYRPSLSMTLIGYLQELIVTLFPGALIYHVYNFLRHINSVSIPKESLREMLN